jgi:hypothetical protein
VPKDSTKGPIRRPFRLLPFDPLEIAIMNR